MLMYIPVLIVMGHGNATSMLQWLWWTISVPRVYIRGKRLVTYFRTMEMRLDVNVYHLQLYKFTLMIFLTSHWVGCIFFFLSRLVDHSTDTWIKQFQVRTTQLPSVLLEMLWVLFCGMPASRACLLPSSACPQPACSRRTLAPRRLAWKA